MPVFNSTCDKNPSCRIICEKRQACTKMLTGSQMHNEKLYSCQVENAHYWIMLSGSWHLYNAWYLTTHWWHFWLFFFLKFHEPLSQTEALETSQRETMPADFTNISLSGMYIIKGRFLDECIDTLKYFSYNNQTTMLFLHGTLLYLHRASLSGELSYTCLQYCFVGIYTKEKIMLTSNEKQLPFFLV